MADSNKFFSEIRDSLRKEGFVELHHTPKLPVNKSLVLQGVGHTASVYTLHCRHLVHTGLTVIIDREQRSHFLKLGFFDGQSLKVGASRVIAFFSNCIGISHVM